MSSPGLWYFSARSPLPRSDRSVVPPEVQGDVAAFMVERRRQLDRWFFMVRMTLGLGLVGYLTIDAVNPAGGVPGAMLFVLCYLLANLGTWFAGGQRFAHHRWVYAALDLGFVLALRHLFHFEALVDPNATMVGLFTMLLIGYTVYSDPALSRGLAAATFLALVGTLAFDAATHAAELVPSYTLHPLRALLLIAYLGAFCNVTLLLARRMREHLLNYGVELQKRMQASMNTSVERTRREKLEELNRLKRNFIAVLSHELRTPIAPLRSSLEMIRAEHWDDAEQRELFTIARESAGKLERLVKDYTQLAELLTLEKDGLLRWNIRLGPLMEALLEGTDHRQVRLQGLDDLVVSADARLLGGALLALVRRARLLNAPDAAITIYGTTDEGRVRLAVHDPGSFLEPEVTSSLDDLFVYSSERAFVSPNTGLELILAQHSVHRLGGSFRVESQPDRGTTVHCLLPGRQYGIQWLNDTQMRYEVESFCRSTAA